MTASDVSNTSDVSVLRDGARRARGIPDDFLAFFVLVLCGYGIGSKGFAYLGIAPIYIGEVSLLVGLVALWLARGASRVLRSPIAWFLLAFMLLSAARTIPYLGEYGVLALRDAALWGYACFAFIVGGLVVAKPRRLDFLLQEYRRFVPILLIAVTILWPATLLFGASTLRWAGTDVPVIYLKGTDTLVQLSGVAAFTCVGFAGKARGWRTSLLILCVVLTGFTSRGGLLAFLCAYAIAFVARPRNRTAWSLAIVSVFAMALLGVTGVALRFPGMNREVSFAQFVQHFATTASTSTGSAGQDLENTKEWRLAWWAVIADYTFNGDYFWTGKGYGVNLADADGFQVAADNSLRTPHSVHMTVLARSGVPGLVVWLFLQILWGVSLARAFVRARRERAEEWSSLFAFLIAFWLSFLVNASFDVYLEGPMGGIWFWCVFGVGIAAVQLYADRRHVMDAKSPQMA
jgi:hypothetical protein